MAKFSKGVSGNPKGRKVGSGGRQQIFNALVAPHGDALIHRAIQMALDGSESMLRVFLDRMLPAKPIDDPVEPIEGIEGSLVEQGEKVLSLLTAGQLPPSQGIALINAISMHNKLIFTDEIVKRIELLEEQCNAKYRKPIN